MNVVTAIICKRVVTPSATSLGGARAKRNVELIQRGIFQFYNQIPQREIRRGGKSRPASASGIKLKILTRGYPELLQTCGVLGMDNQENQGQYPGIALPTLSSIVPAFRTQGAEAYKWICANPGIAGKNRAQTLIRRFPPEGVISRASTATAACTDPLTSRMIRWAWRRVQSEQPVSVSDMASVHHLTLKTLERRFQTYAGGNAVDLLARLKLEYACSLLRETSLPITEIAFRCGYSKQDVLSRALRRSHDCTPREYRKQHSLLTSAI